MGSSDWTRRFGMRVVSVGCARDGGFSGVGSQH